MRERLKAFLKLVISVGLIVWLFSRIDVNEVLSMLKGTNLFLVVLGMILYTGAIVSNAIKWGVLLRAQNIRAPWHIMIQYTFVGVFFNNFLPANVGGDVMRGYGLSEYIQRRADAAVSVVVDRLIGIMALTSMAAVSAVVAFAQRAVAVESLRAIAGIAVVTTAALAGGFALVLSRRLRLRIKLVMERFSLLEPLVPIYEQLSMAIGAYRHRGDALALAFGVALVTWVFSNFAQWVLAESLGGGLPLLYIFLLNPLIGLVLLIPISIGGLGVNQNAFEFFYGLVGIRAPLAVSVSLLLQVTIYATSLPGGVLWWRQRRATQVTAQMPETVAN